MDNPSFAETEEEKKEKPLHGILKKSVEFTEQPVPPTSSEVNLSPIVHLIGSTLAFQLTPKKWDTGSFPQMGLTPLQQSTEQETSPPQIINCSANHVCSFLLCCCGEGGQRISLRRENSPENALTFSYTPHTWCPVSNDKDRIIQVSVHGNPTNLELGWINGARDISQGSQIHCSLTNENFITRKVDEKNCPRSFKIENSSGVEVANGKVITGRFNSWTGFQLNFIPSQIDTLPHAVRAMLLVTFIIWAIDLREKRQWQFIWGFLFIAFILSSFLLIHLFGPGEY